ncbi:hypothetical protein BJ912DRAFT_578128 [Pholiota molesta]|nr:hypothetical protein BJ912DRAFT_578128 [Pholiota molesta]
MPLHHEYEEVYEVVDGDDRLPLSNDDFQRANHFQYEDRPILLPAHSKPHASKRNSIQSRSGARLPYQLERSPSPVLGGGASGANGPTSRPTPLRIYDTVVASSLLAPQTAPPRVLTTGQVMEMPINASRKPEMRSPCQSTNFTFSESPPPVPPKDSSEDISPEGGETTSRQNRKSSHRREAAGVSRDRHDCRMNAWAYSTRLHHYSGLPLDEERTLPLIDQREPINEFPPC